MYGIIRFNMEFLRGDGIRGIYFSLSTSQWISLALILGGVIYNIYPLFAKNIKANKKTLDK